MSVVDDMVAGWIRQGIGDIASPNQVGNLCKSEELHPHVAHHHLLLLLLQQICL